MADADEADHFDILFSVYAEMSLLNLTFTTFKCFEIVAELAFNQLALRYQS